VRSRRQAAVETNLLNRDQPMAKFTVIERSIFMVMSVPAAPLAPLQLTHLLPFFTYVHDAVIDDLAVRTGGRKG
jgi:hypothetical protein